MLFANAARVLYRRLTLDTGTCDNITLDSNIYKDIVVCFLPLGEFADTALNPLRRMLPRTALLPSFASLHCGLRTCT